MSLDYSPLVLESVDPESFPGIDLFVKQQNNYTLYRNKETELKNSTLERLRRSDVEFVFVTGEDAEVAQRNVEFNLKKVFDNEHLSQKTKNLFLSYIMINHIRDAFKNHEFRDVYQKCRTLLQQYSLEIADRKELLELLSKLLHHKIYLFTHSAQVAILSMYVHQKMFNAGHDELVDVGVGGMLHDIGMIHIAGNITDKADVLSPGEYSRVRHHPRHGHDMLYEMGLTSPVSLKIVLNHHERYDGSGYPCHLSEHEIPTAAMVTAMCDIYSALTLDRPYRGASTHEEALETLRARRDLFHPEYFKKFMAIMTE